MYHFVSGNIPEHRSLMWVITDCQLMKFLGGAYQRFGKPSYQIADDLLKGVL